MARFMLSAMPFTGHVGPLCVIASELVTRGHDVRMYCGSAFRGRIEASGARFVTWRTAPDFDENNLPETFPRLVGKKGFRQLIMNVQDVFIETVPAQMDDLQHEWERDPWDAIVADELSLGASFSAEKLGSPWGTVSILPLNLASGQGAPSTLGLTRGRNSVTKLRDALIRGLVPLMSAPINRPIARVRDEVGLPPTKDGMDRIAFSPRLVVATGSPMLDFDRTDRPSSVHFVGELRRTAPLADDLPHWWGDLESRTIVHVTQGTQNIDPTDLIRPALEALADRDVLVVVATGVRGRDELPFPVPANARVGGFLPYTQLLPLVDVVVTNGGWGGTVAALSHGIPLVIGGGDLDKPEIAARVAWTGAGVNLRTGTPTAAQVRRGYDRVVADASFRDAAARVGAELRSLGGPARAADLLETLVTA